MIEQNSTKFSDLPLIMAVDFDGTLVEDEFPEIGCKRERMCNVILKLQKLGIKSILWTARTGIYLEAAVNWCEENGLYFDKVNENLDEVQALTGEDTRKVYANIYIDDKNRSADVYDIADIANHLKGVYEWLGSK